MQTAFKYVAEYLALKVMSVIVNALPYRIALSIGWVNAFITYSLMGRRRKEAKRRIRSVFGNLLSSWCINHIAWISWRNIVFNGIDMLRFPKMDQTWIRKHVDISPVADRIKSYTNTGKGLVVAVPHMGSWDLAGVACHFEGIPIFNIAARQKNPLVNDYMNKMRSAPGIETIERGAGTLRHILKNLKDGKVLAILPDVRMPTPGVKIPLFSGEANLGEGMASFARHADVPILPCIVTRQGWCKHKIAFFDIIQSNKDMDKDGDIRRMTASVLKIIEDAIMEQPEQWFWYNKRWVLDPIEETKEQK